MENLKIVVFQLILSFELVERSEVILSIATIVKLISYVNNLLVITTIYYHKPLFIQSVNLMHKITILLRFFPHEYPHQYSNAKQ